MRMEEENLLQLLLNSTPLSFVNTSSQGASIVSSILAGGPSPSQVPASTQERHWSNDAVRFLLSQCKDHVMAHNSITMRQHQWVRIHKLLIEQFPCESGKKVKSLSDKWEKLRSTYSKIKKTRNQTGSGVRDEGAKFLWYDEIDEILSLTTKANGVPGGMDQGVPVPRTGTSSAPVDVSEDEFRDGKPLSPPRLGPIPSTGTGHESTGSSPRTRAANLVGCRGKGASSKPNKRAKVDRNLMDTLDRLVDSTTEIDKLRIEASLTVHRENLLDRQENRKLELDLFQLQEVGNERMASFFADVVKKNA